MEDVAGIPAGPGTRTDWAMVNEESAHTDEGTGSAPEEPGSGVPALSDAERAERLVALSALVDLMRPAVQADGGDLVLTSADVETGVVEVQLQGACSSCAVSSSTLQGGVERILMDRLPWVREVRGGLDDSLSEYESAALGRGGYVPGY
jgi:Fe-S cluster biogenesis protein NfuA